jgi:cyclohexanone monooxygenase
MDFQEDVNAVNNCPDTIDVVIVGAGFAGLFMLHHLREHGFTAKIFETSGGIGGTWYWNRYPGARCDVESMQYSYSFSEELQQNWHWSERFAAQPEILRYLNHVADKFDLRKDIQLDTRVISAIFDEAVLLWEIKTNRNDRLLAKFCIMATGCLSAPKTPDIKGLDRFEGNIYSTSKWPHENVNFTGRRVAIIGTGPSGVQCIPIITKEASHVYVFQRTPNYCIPSNNGPLDPKEEQRWKSNYAQLRHDMLQTGGALLLDDIKNCSALSVTPKERQEVYESAWQKGGHAFILPFNDIFINKEANDTVSNFVKSKIRATVKNPAIARILLPYDHLFGIRRPCRITDYYETFNRDNITLVDLRYRGIDEIQSTAIRVGNKIYEVDDIVLALGFDAFTGALLNIDIRGRSGKTLREKWTEGSRTYLGLMIADFPNLFTITGPGSPSDLANMVPHIEEHVKWITKCLEYLRTHHINMIEPTVEAEDAWVKHVNDVVEDTLFRTAKSLYNGANIPGKPRVFIPYVGGFDIYMEKCEKIAMNGYEGFRLTK